jgi:hypothetical protein
MARDQCIEIAVGIETRGTQLVRNAGVASSATRIVVSVKLRINGGSGIADANFGRKLGFLRKLRQLCDRTGSAQARPITN